MTLLIASCFGDVPNQLSGADLLELRIDGFTLEECKTQLPILLQESPIPTIVTCRSVQEGGFFEGDEEELIARYEIARQSDSQPRYFDVEFESVRKNPNLIETIRTEQTGILLSWHDVRTRPSNLLQHVEEMNGVAEADVIKIVWRARSIRDNIEAFELLQTRQKPMIVLCMGEYGVMSRVLAPKFGGFATYASVDGKEQTASGQLTLSELRSTYGFGAITESTRVYGVIGNNVSHSASPQFHNAAFQAAGENAVYLPLQIPEGWEHLKASVGELRQYEPLKFSGASVTIPHKEAMIQLADSTDNITESIGATNTVTIEHQRMIASNSDVIALTALIGEAEHVLILGGGGVARAAIVASKEHGAAVWVITRREEQAQSLCETFACQLATAESASPQVIINCTPVGMEGGTTQEGNPLIELAPWITLNSNIRIIETVYKPKETPLIQYAKDVGCPVIYGEEMFRLQAVEQQKVWA